MDTETKLPWPPAHPDQQLFAVAPEYLQLNARDAQLARLTLPTGDDAWLATRHQDVRTVLSDRRFSSITRPLHRTGRQGTAFIGRLLHSDPPEHTRYRTLVNRAFSARRVRALEPRIHQLTEEHLDAMAAGPRPADLVEAFAHPVPLQVLCELLGIPETDHTAFLRPIELLLSHDVDGQHTQVAIKELLDWMISILAAKRLHPDDGLLSELAEHRGAEDEELADLAITVLMGGYESTTGMIAASVAVLAQHPQALQALRADEADWDRAVAELLRYITVIHYGLDRMVTEDLVLNGQMLHAGERVIAFLPAANQDPELSAEPQCLNIYRAQTRHASFGFGPHQCVGQQLARTELRITLSGLLRRFPGLRLAVDPGQLRYRSHMVVDGLQELPVTF